MTPEEKQKYREVLYKKLNDAIGAKVKDWTNPTKEELATLSEAEKNHLAIIHKNYNISSDQNLETPQSGPQSRLDKLSKKNSFPDEEAERKKYIESTPNKTVSLEQYNTLKELGRKALEADPTGNKKTKEAEAFQIAYHDLLPGAASKVIAEHPVKTRKALSENRTWWDLEGNVDSYAGPRTKRYLEELEAFKPEDKKIAEAAKEPEKEREAFKTNTPVPYTEAQNAPWWLQDIIKTAGAVGDKARIKKYLPWQATAPVTLPEATFYDPTRELAANAEQANIANQTAAAFTDPRQLAAQQAATQGLAGKNAADIMGRYNTMNVGLANQASQQQASIMNAANQNKANMDTQLWDKYTIANQQFDNSKNQARQQIRQSYMDAITNRANTANLNTLYPQYSVDPSSGGFAYFKPDNSPINPAAKYDRYDALWEKAQKYSPNPDVQEKIFKDMLGKGEEEATPGAYEGYQNRQRRVG